MSSLSTRSDPNAEDWSTYRAGFPRCLSSVGWRLSPAASSCKATTKTPRVHCFRNPPELIPRFSGDISFSCLTRSWSSFHYETLPDDQLCPSFDSSALQHRSIVELRVSGKQRSHLVHCLLLNVGGRTNPLKVRSVHVLMVLNKLPTLIRMRSSQFLPRPSTS